MRRSFPGTHLGHRRNLGASSTLSLYMVALTATTLYLHPGRPQRNTMPCSYWRMNAEPEHIGPSFLRGSSSFPVPLARVGPPRQRRCALAGLHIGPVSRAFGRRVKGPPPQSPELSKGQRVEQPTSYCGLVARPVLITRCSERPHTAEGRDQIKAAGIALEQSQPEAVSNQGVPTK